MLDSAVYVEGHEGDRGPLPPPFLHSFFIALTPLLPYSLLRCSVFSCSSARCLLSPGLRLLSARSPLALRCLSPLPCPPCSACSLCAGRCSPLVVASPIARRWALRSARCCLSDRCSPLVAASPIARRWALLFVRLSLGAALRSLLLSDRSPLGDALRSLLPLRPLAAGRCSPLMSPLRSLAAGR